MIMMMMRGGFCPNCQARLPNERALACPQCGSCEETGWSERAHYEAIGVDFDEGEFDYDQFVKDEFAKDESQKDRTRTRNQKQIVIAIIAAFLAIVFLLF